MAGSAIVRSFEKCRISLDLSGSENNEINIEGISFILRVMIQTMTFMIMMAMGSKQKARSLSKLRRRQI